MNEQLPSDSWLSRTKALTELPGENALTNQELLALVACAEALQLCMAILKHEAMDKIAVIRALDKGRDALANLEAL